MRKQMIIATSLAVLSTSAYASKARMSALGQDADFGSFYIQDTRNVFRNAAHVNTFTNYVITEWGVADPDPTEDEIHGEGGFFRQQGAFNYGVYFGSTRNHNEGSEYAGTSLVTPTFGEADDNFVERSNDLDLFFGGDTGAMQWGARLSYSKSKVEPSGDDQLEAERSSMGLGFGVVMDELSAWLNLELKDEADNGINASDDNTWQSWEADTSIRLGAAYQMGNMTLFGEYAKEGWEHTYAEGETDASEMTTLSFGVGQVHEASATSRLFLDVTFERMSAEDTKHDDADAGQEMTWTQLPVTIGFESDATSWLTLRGSVQQNVLLGTKETKPNDSDAPDFKETLHNSTVVNAGATLNFGNLKLDGSFSAVSEGALNFGDEFLGQVAVHYWF